MSYIEFQNVTKTFGSTQVLKGITLGIEKGELATLLGPSGCGKSTLLRCLAGLEDVTSGRVVLDGRDITDVEPRKREIGMVFQHYSLFPNMTVAKNVAFGLENKKIPKHEIKEKVASILDVVGLMKQADQYPLSLSGGQQQRAALARALVTEPKVLLLDEPLSAIDALLRHNLQIEIRRIQKELGITAIFVTHDQDEAMVMSDTIHLMYQGRIEQSGTPAVMYTKPATRFAASFIGHYNVLKNGEMKSAFETEPESEVTAFRPEVVHLLAKADASSDEYAGADVLRAKGRVIASLPHGNIIRYAVMCGDVQIDADELFDMGNVRQEGEEVVLALRKKDCIHL
jgi:putative spermidine/putrescine transport system ATP-binding protein